MKSHFSILLFSALLFLALTACRHKKQLVDAHEKKVVKKENGPVKNQPTKPNKEDAALTWQQRLGLNEKEVKNNKLYSFINDWYAVPYKYGGCLKSGVDCSCFSSILYQTVYTKSIARTAGDMFLQCDLLSLEDAKEGDLVFFKMESNKITHVGVYLKNDLFVHASTSKGVVLSSLQEAYYKKYFFSAGRIKKS